MATQLTPEQIKKDDNFLCSLEIPKSISLYLTYTGSDKVQYHAFLNGALLFEGKDFRPAPSYGIDSLESIASLLSFLTLRPGDTDDDYFKAYTPSQLAWCESYESQRLNGLVNDLDDERQKQYYNQAKKYFTKYFHVS